MTTLPPISLSEQDCTHLGAEYYESLSEAPHLVRRLAGKDEDDAFCFAIDKQEEAYKVQTSYYVGADWITKDIAIQVRPKVEDGKSSIDYISMLVEALQQPEAALKMDGLVTVDFQAKPIRLEQKEDTLSPFLIAQFIMTLKSAIRKGLRKSYYLVTENLHSKVKGKILVEQNIQKNLLRRNFVDNVCRYQEYGVNNEENKILKKALALSSRMLLSYHGALKTDSLRKIIAMLRPYFREVDDDFDLHRVESFSANPIFKDYFKALEYAILIIKRCSYGINKNATQTETTPPYWIDMSKLFELYVYKRLREQYSSDEIFYQPNIHGRYPDYLLKPKDCSEPYVIDAKYKTDYANGFADHIDDIRQVSAYARMKGVYAKLGISSPDKMIKCLIIYPKLSSPMKLDSKLPECTLESSPTYYELYKLGVGLPIH